MRLAHRGPMLVAALGACASAPVPSEHPSTERLVVRLLDGSFVLFEDRRMAVEEFVYELRRRCRAVDHDPERVPWIEVRVPREAGAVRPSPRVLDTIRSQAYDIGVRHIDMITDDGSASPAR